MEEGGVPIVKLTRLRRRLSVEAEDVKSPSTPSTPTKKRGGRLAAKPLLELIDEHAGENVPKKPTGKSIVRDIVDVVEKPVTPSRRSARIRSNTSIVSDTPQNVDSPRAKRAARRISQAGSDNECPSTPARQTRRTRKDSTSSLDKVDAVANNKISPVTDVIVEEVENSLKGTKDSDSGNSETPSKKSPRLKKNGRRSGSFKPDDTVLNETHENKTLNTSIDKNELTSLEGNAKTYKLLSPVPLPVKSDLEEAPEAKCEEEPNLSITSSNLIKELDTESKKTNKKYLNKSLSSVEVENNLTKKRHRTKSWTTITKSSSSDGSFYSDTEISKQKERIKNKSFSLSNTSGVGLFNKDEEKENSETKQAQENLDEIVTFASKANKSITQNICIEEAVNISASEKPNDCKSSTETTKDLNHSTESKANSQTKNELKKSEKVFEVFVYIDDSDSNAGNSEKQSIQKISDEDQCVPVVPVAEQQLVKHEATASTHNDTCEPMDIDETIPENVTIPDFQNQTSNSICKSTLSIPPAIETSANNSNNKSMRKSITISESQNLDKSGNDNKSTLILSQIKDLSSNESKSMKVTRNEDSPIVKLAADTDLKTQSQNYSTSTPLQQKANKRLGLPLNTSIISSNKSEGVKDIKNTSQNKISDNTINSDSSEQNSDSDEEPKEKSRMFDDEAEEASDDYESGDSRNEDERRYEEENEIKERGETLDSDDDISNDTDYEKDSFLVSSDEEDNDLLSGSGDDLSLTDNELTMSAKSKNKFNKRKEKEQKIASREMYDARHKNDNIDTSRNSESAKPKKNNRMRLDSTLMDSDSEDVTVPSKKNSRQRIDSVQDISTQSETDKSVSRIKKKTKRLSESFGNESVIKEKEITINNQSILDKNDPLAIQLKQEPKTPQKDLDLSTVLITNGDEVEEVNVNENNLTAMNMNETSDPLQATVVITDDSSSSNDNAEIIKNYDSMLNNLNSDVKKKRSNVWDTSLNLNKKTKSKSNAPIVDQLNLTLTRKTKKTTGSEDVVIETQDDTGSATTSKTIVQNNDEDFSSDSIDMRLLFPEDSNDSEAACKNNNDKPNMDTDEFIPLKRTEGKTDITQSLDATTDPKEVSILNISKKKDKKRQSAVQTPEQMESKNTTIEPKEESTLNISKKKEKKRKSSLCLQEQIESNNTIFDAEECYMNMSKKDKKRKSSICVPEQIQSSVEVSEHNENSTINVSQKKEKKRKSSQCPPEEINLSNEVSESTEESILNVSKKEKKRNSLSTPKDISSNDEEPAFFGFYVDTTGAGFDTVPISDVSLTNSAKKKNRKNKNKSISSVRDPKVEDNGEECDNDAPLEISYQNDKKKKSKLVLDISQTAENKTADIENTAGNTSQHKKKKSMQSLDSSQIILDLQTDTLFSDNVPDVSISRKDKKKNKRLSETAQSGIEVQTEDKDNNLISQEEETSPKKGKRKSSGEPNREDNVPGVSISRKDKKNNKKLSETAQSDIKVQTEDNDDNLISHEEETSSKKRKRKSSGEPNREDLGEATKTLNESLTVNNKKKKQKITNKNEVFTAEPWDLVSIDAETVNIAQDDTSDKKSKVNKQLVNQENIKKCAALVNDFSKKSRKRKDRDGDDASKISKIFKANSFDKVHVPRLPASIINQLDAKPQEVLGIKKPNAVSTTQFIVEKTKKKKSTPSNYLEESVYLNESPISVKQKGSLKKPKVLPFIPTASTSASGFTTKFRVNQIPKETQFIAQSSNISNFKNDYLQSKRIKKLGTYEMYKKGRNIKLSKF